MCMAVFSADKKNTLLVPLATEWVCLEADGSAIINVDFLITNTSNDPVSKVRIAFPYALCDRRAIEATFAKSPTMKLVKKVTKAKQNEQLENISLLTEELQQDENTKNWIYRAKTSWVRRRLPCPQGFCVEKTSPPAIGAPKEDMEGDISKWKISIPSEMTQNPFLWSSFTVCNSSVFDLSPSSDSAREIAPKGSMWFRISCHVPRTSSSIPLSDRLFSPTHSFSQHFLSSAAVCNQIANGLKSHPILKNRIPSLEEGEFHLVADVDDLVESLKPSKANLAETPDWRSMFYCSDGLQLVSIENMTTIHPLSLHEVKEEEMPRCAFNFSTPVLPSQKNKTRPTKVHSLWTGSDNKVPDRSPGSFVTVKTSANNKVLSLLPWFGFAGFVMSCFTLFSNFLPEAIKWARKLLPLLGH